ncbi:hypothetical protein Sinac_3254 [Singulisphaera acidiphila DSM 18658]|uniref:Uncharacterized protein n=1 Tax=Singulisphaera acidiphila (strain ATCC BAA-1392 / DSM 18658 / VKM B-2454 / MOB10) TaxID=886293 RepID=L0DF92_SINAD|nr:hypothetical protein Sinac_3254 [Singulisphaera acidiphila DSM 18658]
MQREAQAWILLDRAKQRQLTTTAFAMGISLRQIEERLYWNPHPFGSGPRKDLCPYQRLGLKLTSYDFWELLRSDPTEWTQQLSTEGNTE